MKVIYESYMRRHRSASSHNNNNNGINIEICHPNDFTKNINSSNTVDQDNLMRPNIAHMISCDSLLINKELGVGEFGVVQQGNIL